MKTVKQLSTLAVLVIAALAVQALWVAPADANTVGQPAPDFTLQTHDGKSLTLSSLEGKRGVVLVFFATWCPACMAEVPQVKRFVEESRERNVLVYGVNIEQSQRIVDKFVQDHAINYRVLLDADGAVAKTYAVTGIPTIVGIDADGIVRFRDHALPKDKDAFVAELTKPLGKAVPAAGEAAAEVQLVDRATLQGWRTTQKNLVIVDVLPPEAYHRAHIEGAINIPLAQLESLQKKLPKDARIVTYCASFQCRASTQAAKQLQKLGYADVHDYKGGIADWLEGNLPAVKGKPIRFVDKATLQTWMRERPELVIVDVLSPAQYAKVHIRGAINIPLADLEKRAGELGKDARIVTYCANYPCHASSMAAETLTALGFQDVYDYKGGIHEWEEAKLPVDGSEAK